MTGKLSMLHMDDRHVYSRSGKAYPRHTPRDRNHVHEPRLPFVKRATAKGKFYFYFVGPGRNVLGRLPAPTDPGFPNAYLNELAKLEGEAEEAYRAPVKQYVYFIGGEVGAVKIGIARNPEARLANLQSGCPIPLRIMAIRLGTRADERSYHKRFAAHRLHGEWFKPHPDILTEIERLQTISPPHGLIGGRG